MEDKTPAATPVQTAIGLPSISQLFHDSWDTFKKSILHLVIFYLNLIVIALLAIVVILALGIILGLGLGSISGLFSSISGGQKDFVQIIALMFSGVMVILLPIFFVVSSIIVLIAQSGMILILDQAGKSISYSSILRKGLSLVLPLIGVGFLTFFITLGGLFIFIVPALLFSFFFVFATYEVVLSDMRGTEALKRSYHLISKNFWEILGRFLILIGIYILYVIFSSILNFLTENASLINILISIIDFIFSIIIGWFMGSYEITLYKQAKAAVNPSEKVSLKWVWIVSLIGWVFGVLILIATASLIGKYASSGALQKALDQSKKTTSNSDTNDLADETFLKVNEYRQQNNLPLLEEDNKLCAYAQRRLEQLAKFGKWDDAKGFYEDTANNDIWNAYFNNYTGVNETGYTVYSSTSSDKVINWWTKQENPLIKKAEYTNGCIRADEQNLEFILGVHK